MTHRITKLCYYVEFFYYYAECHYAECRYAECRYAKCRSAIFNHIIQKIVQFCTFLMVKDFSCVTFPEFKFKLKILILAFFNLNLNPSRQNFKITVTKAYYILPKKFYNICHRKRNLKPTISSRNWPENLR